MQKISGILNAPALFRLLFILLPPSLILLMQTRYDFHASHILGFLIVLVWFCVSILSDKTIIRLLSVILLPLLYYLAGSFTVVYLGLYIVYSLVYQKGILRYLLPAILLTAALATFIVFRNVLFLQPVSRMLAFPLFLNDTLRLTIFLSLFSALLVFYPLLIKTSRSVILNKKINKYSSLITILTVFSLSAFILLKNYDPVIAGVMKFEKMVYNQDWEGVIRQHEKRQSSNIVEQYYYNLALAEEGQLCTRMFFGRQSSGSMSLTLRRDDEQSYRALYFYYSVGLTGEAHHLAYELMVQHGYRPENIKMLIKTELINGNFKIAERYINVLKKTLHYRKWARKYERMLYRPELVNSDQELGGKIRLLPKEDFFIVTDDFRNLDMLLQGNPENRIAFEYKMAKLLLEKDLMEVGSEIKKLKGLGYAQIPRHIEEAIVSYVNITRKFPDLGGLTISSDTDQRFLRYFSDLKSFRGNRKLVEKGINKADKNTFWYYLQYGLIKSEVFRNNPEDNSIY